MNRLVIIGNGFDMAHGLKTSYMDFINWYWERRLNAMLTEDSAVSEDCLCKLEIKMSRANLYKKMQSILGITPNDFIRNVRLKKAAQLLADTKTPVNQITLMVGFQTPRYFSQCFKKMFGLTPVEYREGRKEGKHTGNSPMTTHHRVGSHNNRNNIFPSPTP
jgi:AraC-like DNA-binding protein